MQISEISRVVGPTLSRQLFMLAKQYDDVVDFTLGDPDLPTPRAICEAANEAAMQGKTHYAPNSGLPELCKAIADRTCMETGTNYTADNVTVTVGATEAFYLVLKSILNEEDEVIILAPYWIQYENICKLLKANPVIVDQFTHGFNIDANAIKATVTDKTKAIIFNSPNNPSGYIYDDSLLKSIADIATVHHLYVLADEVYKALIYKESYPSIAQFCPRENLILFNSFSKQFAMTGWRVGYVVADEELTKTITKMQQNVAVCVSTLSQYAAIEALRNEEEYTKEIRAEFEMRRNILVEEFSSCSKVKFIPPMGTFYAFLDISETGMTSKDFCISLLEKKHVATIPGVAFGEAFDKYIRLAFTLKEDRLKEGISKIKNFVNSL